jgi:Leu/Phe-tRNA-protein transferase
VKLIHKRFKKLKSVAICAKKEGKRENIWVTPKMDTGYKALTSSK